MLFHFVRSSPDDAVRAVFSWDFNLYWVAADVLRQFRYLRVGVVLRNILKKEPLMRFSDVSRGKNGNTFLLSCDQVFRFAARIPASHGNEPFCRWFEDVLRGLQHLNPEDEKLFEKFLRHPEKSDSLVVRSVTTDTPILENAGSVFEEGSFSATFSNEEADAVVDVEEEEEEQHHELKIDEETKTTEEEHHEPKIDEETKTVRRSNEDGRRYVFKLPELVRWMKSKHVPPIMTSDFRGDERSGPANPGGSHEETSSDAKKDGRDALPLELNASLAYDFKDVVFDEVYTFYAVRCDFVTERRSIAVNPFWKTVGNDNFLFVPVKQKKENDESFCRL